MSTVKTKSARSYKRRNMMWLYSLPFMIFMTIMVVLPLVMFFYNAINTASEGNWYDSFHAILTSSNARQAMLRSLWIATVTAIICIILAYPVAYGLAVAGFKRGPTVILLFIAPMWISLLIRAVALRSLFLNVGISQQGLFPLITAMVIDYLPLAIIPIYLVLTGKSKKYMEASYDLGAKPHQTFFKTTLPLSIPGLVTAFLFVFVPTVSSFFLPLYFGTTDIIMIGEIIFGFAFLFDLSAAMAIFLVLIVVVITFVLNLVAKIKNKKGGMW